MPLRVAIAASASTPSDVALFVPGDEAALSPGESQRLAMVRGLPDLTDVAVLAINAAALDSNSIVVTLAGETLRFRGSKRSSDFPPMETWLGSSADGSTLEVTRRPVALDGRSAFAGSLNVRGRQYRFGGDGERLVILAREIPGVRGPVAGDDPRRASAPETGEPAAPPTFPDPSTGTTASVDPTGERPRVKVQAALLLAALRSLEGPWYRVPQQAPPRADATIRLHMRAQGRDCAAYVGATWLRSTCGVEPGFALAVTLSPADKAMLAAVGVGSPTRAEASPELGYGQIAGLCRGYCKREMRISGSHVTFFTVPSFWRRDAAGRLPALVGRLELSADEVAALERQRAALAAETLPERFGCPGCTDGVASWIELPLAEERFARTTYGSDNAPPSLRELDRSLSAIFGRFAACTQRSAQTLRNECAPSGSAAPTPASPADRGCDRRPAADNAPGHAAACRM